MSGWLVLSSERTRTTCGGSARAELHNEHPPAHFLSPIWLRPPSKVLSDLPCGQRASHILRRIALTKYARIKLNSSRVRLHKQLLLEVFHIRSPRAKATASRLSARGRPATLFNPAQKCLRPGLLMRPHACINLARRDYATGQGAAGLPQLPQQLGALNSTYIRKPLKTLGVTERRHRKTKTRTPS